jgi:hypothetical protein
LVLNQNIQVISFPLPKISVVRPLHPLPTQHPKKLIVIQQKEEKSFKELLVENLGADKDM